VWSFSTGRAGGDSVRQQDGAVDAFVLGFAWAAGVLKDSAGDVYFTAGLTARLAVDSVLILLMAYPSGELDRRSRIVDTCRWLCPRFGAAFPRPSSGGGVSRESASNLLLVTHRPTVLTVVENVSLAVALAVVAIGFFRFGRDHRHRGPTACTRTRLYHRLDRRRDAHPGRPVRCDRYASSPIRSMPLPSRSPPFRSATCWVFSDSI
jgi:hypothetical protein